MSKFLTAKEVAELLGCSLRKVRQATKDGQLPVAQIGGLYRYNLEAITSMGSEPVATEDK